MRLRQNLLALQSSMRTTCIFCRHLDAALRLPTKLAESCPIKPRRCGDQCCIIQVFCQQLDAARSLPIVLTESIAIQVKTDYADYIAYACHSQSSRQQTLIMSLPHVLCVLVPVTIHSFSSLVCFFFLFFLFPSSFLIGFLGFF